MLYKSAQVSDFYRFKFRFEIPSRTDSMKQTSRIVDYGLTRKFIL